LFGVLFFVVVFSIECGSVKILDAGVHCVLTFQASIKSLSLTIFCKTDFLLLCLAKMF